MFLMNLINAVSQAALYPVIIILLLLVAVTVVLLVMIVVEYFTERRHFKVSIPAFLRNIETSNCQGLPGIIARAGLVKRQKTALMQLFNARDLPDEARWNVAKRAVFETGRHYDALASIAETIAKIAPMVGLMGTLIPLGPGLDALSQGDMASLAQSLIIAFSTTVVGLISAVICLLIAKVRRRWNADYANALEAMQGTLYDRLEELAEEGDLEYTVPVVLVEDKGGADDSAEQDAEGGDADEHEE